MRSAGSRSAQYGLGIGAWRRSQAIIPHHAPQLDSLHDAPDELSPCASEPASACRTSAGVPWGFKGRRVVVQVHSIMRRPRALDLVVGGAVEEASLAQRESIGALGVEAHPE